MALNLKICLLFAILVAGFGVDGRYFKRDERQLIGSDVCTSTGYGTCIPLYPGIDCDENSRPCSLSCGRNGVRCCCFLHQRGR